MNTEKDTIIEDFILYCKDRLGIEQLPLIQFTNDRDWAVQRRSFGQYEPGTRTLEIYTGNRNTADILRTLVHELVHHRQNELGKIKLDSGQTGSVIENEANSIAGIIMRDYGKMNDLIYESKKPIKLTSLLKEVIEDKEDSEWEPSLSDITRDEDDGSLIAAEYTFKSGKYKVIFNSEKPKHFDVSFGLNTGDLNQIDTFQMTNEGNAIQVLKAVAKAINKFYNKYSKQIDKIYISGTNKKRSNLYKQIIPRYIVNPEIMSKIEMQ